MKLLVLANSYKLGGRCVAGIDLDTGKWVRPVGDLPQGSISFAATKVNKAGQFVAVAPLDMIEFSVGQNMATPHHPEDIELRGAFNYLGKITIAELRTDFATVIQNEGPIFGDYFDRISALDSFGNSGQGSLLLVHVSKLFFNDVAKFGGIPKPRGSWSTAGGNFNLAITDPEFEHVRGSLIKGVINGALVTISLGEEFQGSHYKLIATVLPFGEVVQQGSF